MDSSSTAPDAPTAVFNAIRRSGSTRPAEFPPFLIWFGPDPPGGYRRLGIELSGVPMYVKAMPGFEDSVAGLSEDFNPPAGYFFPPGQFFLPRPASSFCAIADRYWATIDNSGSQMPPQGKMYFDPGLQTFPTDRVLLIGKCYLDVPDCPVPRPVFNENYGDGETTDAGVTKVVVLFKAKPFGNGRAVPTGQYMFLANQPYWVLQNSHSTPDGGDETVKVTVGFSEQDADSFYARSSIKSGVDVGVVTSLFNLGYSTDVSKEMSVSIEHDESHSLNIEIDITVKFPKADLSQLWQGYASMALYDSDGSIIAQREHMTRDTRITYQR